MRIPCEVLNCGLLPSYHKTRRENFILLQDCHLWVNIILIFASMYDLVMWVGIFLLNHLVVQTLIVHHEVVVNRLLHLTRRIVIGCRRQLRMTYARPATIVVCLARTWAQYGLQGLTHSLRRYSVLILRVVNSKLHLFIRLSSSWRTCVLFIASVIRMILASDDFISPWAINVRIAWLDGYSLIAWRILRSFASTR